MDVWFNGRLTVTKVNTLISVRLDLSGLSRGETRFASLWKKTHRGKKKQHPETSEDGNLLMQFGKPHSWPEPQLMM